MRPVIAALALFLPACASTAEMASQPAARTYQSAKARDGVAECLLNRISGVGIKPEKTVAPNVTTVGFTATGGLAHPGLFLFTIHDAGTGSSIEARRFSKVDLSTAESCF